MPDSDFYAPAPNRIKTVIVVEDNGACQTYPDLLSALTAVYRLGSLVQEHISDIVTRTSELNQSK